MRLGQRLIAVLIPTVIISTLLGAGLVVSSVRGELINAEMARLELATTLRQTGLDARMGELRRDVAVLASTPALRGLARTLPAPHQQPGTDDSRDEWSRSVTALFIETLRYKPHYVQARVILLTPDGAPELIRVERHSDGTVHVTPPTDLQDKSGEPYVMDGREASHGEVTLSNITLNREHGHIEVPHRPMLRATSLVRDENGSNVALLVMNVSMGEVLDGIVDAHEGAQTFSVVDNNGHVLAHPVAGVAFSHELGTPTGPHHERVNQSIGRSASPSDAASWIDTDNAVVGSVRRIPLGGTNERALMLVGEQSFGTINSVLTAALSNVALAGGLLALLAAAFATITVRYTVAPIVTLTQAVADFDPDSETVQLPEGLAGEAGDLALVLHKSLDALKTRNRAIAANNVELEQFAYIASHDLQEPLRTITSFTKILSEEHGHAFDDEANQMMGFILESCDRMSALIHDLLDFSRIRHEPQAEDINLSDLVDDILADLGASIHESQAVVDVAALPTVRMYPQGARVLFQNLISNAIKYHRPGVPPRIRVTYTPTENGHTFRVTDNGIGIANEYRDKVFRIFQRLHQRSEFDGTGIGLAHCARVVSMHGGVIGIEDGDDGGITVVAVLKDLT